MEAYTHFLDKFDNGDDNNQSGTLFNQIINHLKLSQQQKNHQLSKKKKELNHIIYHQSNHYSTSLDSKSIIDDRSCQESDAIFICKMQHIELLNEIQQIKLSTRSLKQSKNTLQSQISILQAKDQSINNTLIISKKDSNEVIYILQKEKININKLQIKNNKQLHQLQNKSKQIKDQLKNISLSLLFKAKNIISKRQYNNQSIIKHLPFIQKPIYTKLQLQSVLRCFYVILKMKQKWQNNDFQKVDFQLELDSIQKIRVMSKQEILNTYQNKGCLNNQLVHQICQLYQTMSSKFQRTQRLNLQLTQNLNQLRQTQHQLNLSLEKIHENKAKQTIQKLIQDEKMLKVLEDKVCQNCKIIFKFNIMFHQLIKKTISLNRTFDLIMKRTKTEFKSALKRISYDSNIDVVKNFQQLLQRSPQQIKLKWNCLIQEDGLKQQGQQYMHFIIRNDLMRMLAAPKFYCHQKSPLENYDSTFNKVFKFEQILINNFYQILEELFKAPIDAIEKHQLMKQYNNLEVTDNQVDDDINRLCVESKQYFRRDNYKLLQKIEKIELKKKGLYYNAPFQIGIQNQLVIDDNKKPLQRLSMKKIIGIRDKLSMTSFLTTSRHNILSEKRNKIGSQQKGIRKILGQISQIASKNHQYRIKKQRNTHSPLIHSKM